MAGEGEFPKSDGDILYASEVNGFHNRIIQIYTGDGFDSSQIDVGTDTQEHELDAVSSSTRDYVKIKFTGTSSVSESYTGAYPTVSLTAQIKETGESYGDIVPAKVILTAGGSDANYVNITSSYSVIATLTAGQKSNGYQIKLISSSFNNESGSANFTNIQTVIEETS